VLYSLVSMPFDYNAWKRTWREKHPDRARQIVRESARRRYADPVQRERIKAAVRSDYERHKEARLAKRREWAAANHDKVLAMAKDRYFRLDPRKRFAYHANRKARDYGFSEMLDWMALPEGPWTCFYCGMPCESWDHVEQLALGGRNHPSNLVPACLSCNRKKDRRTRTAVFGLAPRSCAAPECSVVFVAHHATARYCSKRCGSRHQYLKKRAAEGAAA
jgi:5-methylcytosine-specific restriction endonuclease McrA